MKWITRQTVLFSVQYAHLTEDAPSLSLKCSHFEPEDGDIVERKWGNLPHHVLKIPTYCAIDVAEIIL